MNLSGLAALSASYPAYLKGRQDENKADESDIALRDAKRSELAKVAMGNALQLLAQGGQQGPQAPMPGQMSQPASPPMGQPPMQPGGMPGGMAPRPSVPGMPGGGGTPGGPAPGGLAPAGGAPMAPQGAPPQGMPQAAPRSPQMGQQLTWQGVLQAVKQANPGLPPDVAATVVNQFLPMMNQQSQMEWRLVSLQLREQQIEARERMVREQEAGRDRRTERVEEGRTARIETTEAGRTERMKTAEEGRAERAKTAEEGREKRSARSDERQRSQFQQREGRLQNALKLREDSTWQRLEQQRMQAQQRAEAAQGRQGLAELRATIDAQDKHIRQRIQAYSSLNTMTKQERAAMLKEADDAYNQQLEQMRTKFGKATGGAAGPNATPSDAPAGPKDQGRVGELPPQAVQQLKEGVVTTFQNGQKWTLEGGKPKQVP